MGSILSFPVLCLVTLTTALCFHAGFRALWDPLSKKGRLRLLMGLRGLGVNGDDLALKRLLLGCDSLPAWIRGVAAVGGQLSRGKSLMGEGFVTINSEIVYHNVQVPVVRSSLLVTLNDNSFKAPAVQWRDMLGSSLFTPAMRKAFNPDDVLFPDMPRLWGGTANSPVSFEDFNPARYRFLQLMKGKVEFDFSSERNFRTFAVQPSLYALPMEMKPRPSGWYTKESVEKLAVERFGTMKNQHRWRVDRVRRIGVDQAWKEAYSMGLKVTPGEKTRLYRRYKEAIIRGHAGHVYLEHPLDSWGPYDDPILVPAVDVGVPIPEPLPITVSEPAIERVFELQDWGVRVHRTWDGLTDRPDYSYMERRVDFFSPNWMRCTRPYTADDLAALPDWADHDDVWGF